MSMEKTIIATVKDVALYAAETGMISHQADDFLNQLILRRRRGATEGWTGGCVYQAGVCRPRVSYSLHPRYTDKREWLDHLRTRVPRQYRSLVWQLVCAAAHRDEWMLPEYARIYRDPRIGSFVSDDPLAHIRATACHEVAHAQICWDAVHAGTAPKPHGPEWQQAYGALRDRFVNTHYAAM